MAQSSSQPLSVGNVVTTAFQLYKNRFQPYFLLALKAYFWLLIPVYGWAKFSAISALISRLAYKELVNQPETIKDGTRYVNSKLWQFFLAGILLGLIALGVYIAFAIAVGIAAVFGGLVIGSQGGNFALTAIAVTLSAIAVIAFIVGFFIVFIRFFVFELPLALEDNIDASTTISRSWRLTKGFAGRILLISFVAFLITFPLLVLVQFVSTILQLSLAALIDQNSVFNLLLVIFTLCLSFASGALQLPFWQAIKAVIYYDLLTRKEGLGLNLRDRNI